MKQGVWWWICVSLLAPVAACETAVATPRADTTPALLRFEIPPQALSTALIAFGKQANVQVLTAAGAIAKLHSGGIRGPAAPAAALAALLQGSGLDYVFIDAGTVVVKPGAPSPAASESPHSPGASIADAKLLATVRTEGLIGRDTGYLADATSSVTRTDADLIDVPQSVSVITRDLMDSQQIRTVADAVRNVAGVQSFDYPDGQPLFQIRGFYTGNGMTDGMPNSFEGLGNYPPLIGLERVEVLKGPEAILGDASSNNDFGGMINVVVKKPQSEPVHELSYALGEYGDTQAGLDLAGPLGDSKAWTYRLVLSGEYADRTQQGYHGQRNSYIAPSIGWRGDSSNLVVGAQRLLDRLPVPDHAVLLGDSVSSASPSDLLAGNPSDHSAYQTNRFYYLFEQRLGDDWTLHSRGQYAQQKASQQLWLLDDPMPSGDVDASAQASRYSYAYYTLQNDLTGRFGQGWLTHTLTLGFDYSRSRIGRDDEASGNMPYNLFTDAALPPAKSMVQLDAGYPEPGGPWSVGSSLLLQDQLSIGEYWQLLLALRRSAYELATYDANGNPWNLHKKQWVPNAGLVYKLAPGIALYASTASGFQPDALLGRNGRPLEPAMSRQLEAGAKFNLFDDQTRLTASWYRIMLDRSYDLLSPQALNFDFFTPGPGQTNEGVELEFSGRVAPGLDLSSSYTNARISNHDGSRPTGAPRQRYSLWASYWFQGVVLQGWGVAGGMLARSQSLGQAGDGTYFHIPGQVSVDANVSYRTRRWSMTLGVRNLFARNLYNDDFDTSFVPLYDRRRYQLTGAYDF